MTKNTKSITEEEDVISSVLKKVNNVLAIYLSGSRLNRFNLVKTDYDLLIIIKENAHHLITGGLNRRRENFNTEKFNIPIDAKVYSGTQFARLIIKPTPVSLEPLFMKPLYVSEDFQKNADLLYSDEFQKELLHNDMNNFFKASFSFLRSLEHVVEEPGFTIWKESKSMLQAMKYFRYLDDIIQYGTLKTVRTPTVEELAFKKKIVDQTVNKEDYLKILKQLQQKELAIKKYIDQHDIITKKQEINYDDYLRFIILGAEN